MRNRLVLGPTGEGLRDETRPPDTTAREQNAGRTPRGTTWDPHRRLGLAWLLLRVHPDVRSQPLGNRKLASVDDQP